MAKVEVAALLHAARSVERNADAYYMFALMYLLALRIGEARILRWEHFGPRDKDGRPTSVFVPTLKQREGETPPLRAVPILSHPALVEAAFDRTRLRRGRRRSQWLFSSDGISPYSHRQAHRLWRYCIDAARLRHALTPHSMRHTAATELAAAGAPHRVVQAFLRHASRDVTDFYMHVKPATWAAFHGVLDLPPLRPLPLNAWRGPRLAAHEHR